LKESKEVGIVGSQEGGKLGAITVCHVASGDRWAGAEVQIATLMKAQARRGEFGLLALLLNEGRLAEEIRSCGIPLKVIPESTNGFWGILKEAERFLNGKGVQILHSHRYKENLLAALLARRCNVSVLVRTQHGLPEAFHGLRSIKHQFLQRLDALVARRATDRIISVSPDMTRRLSAWLKPEKIVTIPNGINFEEVHSTLTVEEAKERLGIPRDCHVLGTAGRLEPVKRLDIFLAAAQQIALRLSQTRFLIAGDGSHEVKLRAQAQAQEIRDKVLFLGHRNDIYDVLRAFDLLVLSSDHEGLPMVLLEALGLGVPVVARSVGGVPEVVQDGVNGLLVDSAEPGALAEACERVLGDNALRRRLGEAARPSIIERFSVANSAARVAELYRSLLS
jgi:glycosyltransferase involved in cell wall biosynthesis